MGYIRILSGYLKATDTGAGDHVNLSIPCTFPFAGEARYIEVSLQSGHHNILSYSSNPARGI